LRLLDTNTNVSFKQEKFKLLHLPAHVIKFLKWKENERAQYLISLGVGAGHRLSYKDAALYANDCATSGSSTTKASSQVLFCLFKGWVHHRWTGYNGTSDKKRQSIPPFRFLHRYCLFFFWTAFIFIYCPVSGIPLFGSLSWFRFAFSFDGSTYWWGTFCWHLSDLLAKWYFGSWNTSIRQRYKPLTFLSSGRWFYLWLLDIIVFYKRFPVADIWLLPPVCHSHINQQKSPGRSWLRWIQYLIDRSGAVPFIWYFNWRKSSSPMVWKSSFTYRIRAASSPLWLVSHLSRQVDLFYVEHQEIFKWFEASTMWRPGSGRSYLLTWDGRCIPVL